MNSHKKTNSGFRLPSLYCKTLVKAEFDYRREIRRKLERIQHDNRDIMRRRYANDHVFTHELLAKRHQWFSIDKSYRDTCRIMWNRQMNESGRMTHMTLPSVQTPEIISPLSIASLPNNSISNEDNQSSTNEKIQHDFLYKQPVILEILGSPVSSKLLKHKQQVALRKQSAQKRHANIQATATTDNRYQKLFHTLKDA